MHILYRPYVRCLGAALPAANSRAGASASAAEAGGTGRRTPVFTPVSPCVPSHEHRRVKIAPWQFGRSFGADFQRAEKGAGERHWRFSRQCLFTAARSASCRKGLRVLEIDAFFEVPRTV